MLLVLNVGIDRLWSHKPCFFRESGSKDHPPPPFCTKKTAINSLIYVRQTKEVKKQSK